MGPPSLVDLCMRKCMKQASMIHDLGELPLHLAKPILRRIDRPDQLREIEINSPQYAEEMPELWKRLIARDFRQWERKNYVPKNPLSWYRVYDKYKKENDEELAAAAEKLKGAFSALKAHKDSRSTGTIATGNLPRLPKDGKPIGGGRGPGRGLPDHLTWGGGTKTKLTDGQSFLKKARREAREVAMRRQLSTPTGKLGVPPGQIKKAPAAMVEQKRVQRQQEMRIRAPRRAKTPAQVAEEAERLDREARLLKIKTMSGARPAQVISDSEDDDDQDDSDAAGGYRGLGDILGLTDEDDTDDLFGGDVDDNDDDAGTTSSKTTPVKKPAKTSYLSDSSSAPPKRPTILSNTRRPGSGLLNFRAPGSNSQKRVVSSSPPPKQAPAKPAQVPKQSSPPPPPPRQQPRQAAAAQGSPPKLQQTPHSSPPLRPQTTTTPAGSPPPGLLQRKRKPQVDIFMRNVKKPKK